MQMCGCIVVGVIFVVDVVYQGYREGSVHANSTCCVPMKTIVIQVCVSYHIVIYV